MFVWEKTLNDKWETKQVLSLYTLNEATDLKIYCRSLQWSVQKQPPEVFF